MADKSNNQYNYRPPTSVSSYSRNFTAVLEIPQMMASRANIRVKYK